MPLFFFNWLLALCTLLSNPLLLYSRGFRHLAHKSQCTITSNWLIKCSLTIAKLCFSGCIDLDHGVCSFYNCRKCWSQLWVMPSRDPNSIPILEDTPLGKIIEKCRSTLLTCLRPQMLSARVKLQSCNL